MNDQQIIALYCQRSEAAIYESQRKFDAYCRSIIFRILGSYEDTEECLSDTYLRAWNLVQAAMDMCRHQIHNFPVGFRFHDPSFCLLQPRFQLRAVFSCRLQPTDQCITSLRYLHFRYHVDPFFLIGCIQCIRFTPAGKEESPLHSFHFFAPEQKIKKQAKIKTFPWTAEHFGSFLLVCDYDIMKIIVRATPHNSVRTFSWRFCGGKRQFFAGILCVCQGFTNVFLAEKIRQTPQPHLCGVALERIMNFQRKRSAERRRHNCAVLP